MTGLDRALARALTGLLIDIDLSDDDIDPLPLHRIVLTSRTRADPPSTTLAR